MKPLVPEHLLATVHQLGRDSLDSEPPTVN